MSPHSLIRAWLAPLSAFGLVVALPLLPGGGDLWARLAGAFPPLLVALVAVLALRFNASRVAHACLLLGLGLWTLGLGPESTAVDVYARVVPLSLAGLAWASERGLVTPRGLLRLALVALVAGLVVAAAVDPQRAASSLAAIEAWRPPGLYQGPVGVTAAGVLVAAGSLILLSLRAPTPINSAFLLSVVATALLPTPGLPLPPIALLSGAAAALGAGLVQHSHGLAYLDELTRLPARRALNEQLGKLGRRYALAMIDVDHFKKFNDTYGHDMGDQVLRFLAGHLRRVGDGGRAFRYGGEEFTIVFPRRRCADVIDTLDALRRRVEAQGLVVRSASRPRRRSRGRRQRGRPSKTRTLHITISIGVADRTSRRRTPEAVLQDADKALYRAKKRGRNQVCKA